MGQETKKAKDEWANVAAMLFGQAARFGNKPFLWRKTDGRWQSLSWAEVAAQVAKLAGALRTLGVEAGDRVAIVAENRPEWLIADHAIMTLGAIAVPVYTTYTTRDYLHVLDNSGAKGVIISTARLAATVLPAAHQASNLRFALCLEKPRVAQRLNCEIHDWAAVMAASRTTVDDATAWAGVPGRRDIACLIYTSGTGGAPRGVMQHHGGLLHNCAGARDVIAEIGIGGDVFLSFLPLSHSYEHTGGQFLPIFLGAQIYYAEGLDKLARNIEESRPTVMVVVPRLFEVMRQRIVTQIDRKGGLSAKLFYRAIELGTQQRLQPASMNWWQRSQNRLLDVLVRRKIKKRFGGRLKAMVAGGAPLNEDVGNFFLALGLRLLQGYGQTEAHPVIAVHRLFDIKIETVGKPLTDTEIKIAEDGEILVRGELVMQGYWRDEEATRQVLRDGWLYTGDIGVIDGDGHLQITDRKKDIIVNDKGDNVSPARIEGMLVLEPEIMQAMVHGDRRPHLVGLIVPDSDWLEGWKAEHGKTGALADLRQDRDLITAIDRAISRVNKQLSAAEKVRRFALADEPFTVENSEMTPKLSIRRHVITKRYGDRLTDLY
ncbi:MAG: AMP-dependent synthetase/ligase [Sphingomonadales bacterium]